MTLIQMISFSSLLQPVFLDLIFDLSVCFVLLLYAVKYFSFFFGFDSHDYLIWIIRQCTLFPWTMRLAPTVRFKSLTPTSDRKPTQRQRWDDKSDRWDDDDLSEADDGRFCTTLDETVCSLSKRIQKRRRSICEFSSGDGTSSEVVAEALWVFG